MLHSGAPLEPEVAILDSRILRKTVEPGTKLHILLHRRTGESFCGCCSLLALLPRPNLNLMNVCFMYECFVRLPDFFTHIYIYITLSFLFSVFFLHFTHSYLCAREVAYLALCTCDPLYMRLLCPTLATRLVGSFLFTVHLPAGRSGDR